MQIPIKTATPQRPEGQQSVVGLRTEPLGTVRIGIVGLGERGQKAAERLRGMEHARVVALCDTRKEVLLRSLGVWESGSLDHASCPARDAETRSKLPDAQTPKLLFSYHELCEMPAVDLIYICTDWASHTPIAIDAMEHGKHVAIEVPAAMTLADCWALVDTAERTRRHCTMLENCCYDSLHLATLNAVRRGRMGTVVHVEGGYIHPIGDRWTPWRTAMNRQWRGDLYPTHGIGPACQLLGIHRTDALATLVSMDTAAFARPDFRNGDHTTTMMRTQRGKTILLQHNVVSEHPYTRRYHVVATRRSVEGSDDTPHDLMSLRMDRRLVHCLHEGLPLDIDVYDVAEWCAVGELSRLSIESGNAPVAFPNFLR